MRLQKKSILDRLSLGAALPLATLILFPAGVLAAGPQYQIYPSTEAAGTVLDLSVPCDGMVQLTLVRSGEAPDTIDLYLSTFADQHGNQVDVKIGIPEGAKGTQLDEVVVDRALLPLTLEVADLPAPEGYAGRLFLVRDGAVFDSYGISLSRADVVSPATLVLDQQTLTVPFTFPLFRETTDGPEFTVHLYEESRQWPLDGLFVRLVEAEASYGAFDPKRDLSFEVNGERVRDLWTLPPEDQQEAVRRAIRPGESASVRGKLSGLPAGRYSTKLRFLARNSQESDRQDLSLTFTVRDSIWRVIFALTLAIAFSFFSTKWLKTRRHRIQFQRRLAELCPAWLRHEPPGLSVVWVRSMFSRAENVSRKWLFPGTAVAEAQLTQAAAVLQRLQRVRRLRGQIEGLDQDMMVVYRAAAILGRIVARLGAGPLDEKLCEQVDAELTELESWFQQDQLLTKYQADLEKDISRLLPRVRPTGAPEEQQVIAQLISELKEAHPDEKDPIQRGRKHAALKILWKRRRSDEFGELVRLWAEEQQAEEQHVEPLFEKADVEAWKRLKDAEEADKGQIRFISPRRDSPEQPGAYEPLLFEVEHLDKSIGRSYLFKHGLTYEWCIKLEPSPRRWRRWLRWWRRWLRSEGPAARKPASPDKPAPQADPHEPGTLKLTPVTQEPRVVQYVPRPGDLTASVTIRYSGDEEHRPVEIPGPHLRIGRSSDFGWQRAFQVTELGAVGAAWLVALASGLLMFYLDNPVFGSVKDYLTLVLWGAGADQTKNFLQTLEGFAGSSSGAAGGAG